MKLHALSLPWDKSHRTTKPNFGSALLSGLISQKYWVALAATSLCAYAHLALGVTILPTSLLVVFSCALLIYRVDAYLDHEIPRRSVPWPALLCLGSLLLARSELWLFVIPGLLGCCAYAAPYPTTSGRCRLKDVPGFKAIFVAGSLTAAAVAIPCTTTSQILATPEIVTVTFFLFTLTLLNVITFDLRDLPSDRERHVPTLPVLWGNAATRTRVTFGVAIGLVGLLASGFQIGSEMLLLLALGLALLWLLRKPGGLQHELWVDGLALSLPAWHWLLSAA